MPIKYRHEFIDNITITILRFICDGPHEPGYAPIAEYWDERGSLFQHSLAISFGWYDGSTFDRSFCLGPCCSGQKWTIPIGYLESDEMPTRRLLIERFGKKLPKRIRIMEAMREHLTT